MNNYDDIINMPHHVSKNHRQMDIRSRSAQFAPFAALVGYNEAVKEKARLTNKKRILDDDFKLILNKSLEQISINIRNKPKVTIEYYKPDNKKKGGSYIKVTDNVKRIDDTYKVIYMNNNKINIDDIVDIKLENK